MPTYQLRGIDSELWQRLREKAASQKISVKAAVLKALQRYVGIVSPRCESFNHLAADEQCRESLGHAGDHVDHDGNSWTDEDTL